MDVIHARRNAASTEIEELRVITDFISFNMILSEEPAIAENDFELKVARMEYLHFPILIHDWIYIPNTEWGGEVLGIEDVAGEVKVTGMNFRARLLKRCIAPLPVQTPDGKWSERCRDYVNVSLDANQYLRKLYFLNYGKVEVEEIDDQFVVFDSELTGVTITDKIRFSNYLERVIKTLKENGLRLEAKHTYVEGLNSHVCKISAKESIDYTSEMYADMDCDMEIQSQLNYSNERKYCICLGRGELEEREIVILKVNENGKIVETDPFYDSPHFLSNTIIYDYSSAETRADLVTGGQQRLLEEYSKVAQNTFVIGDDTEYFLGDRIGGYNEVTQIEGTSTIVKKELTIDSNGERIEYKVA